MKKASRDPDIVGGLLRSYWKHMDVQELVLERSYADCVAMARYRHLFRLLGHGLRSPQFHKVGLLRLS